MELKLKSGKTIRATAEKGNKPANWNPSGNHYRVTIKVGRRSHTFDFWESYHNAVNNLGCDVRGALACFASDVTLFKYDQIDDVSDGMKAKDIIRIYKACEKASKESDRLGLSEEDLQELSDY